MSEAVLSFPYTPHEGRSKKGKPEKKVDSLAAVLKITSQGTARVGREGALCMGTNDAWETERSPQ